MRGFDGERHANIKAHRDANFDTAHVSEPKQTCALDIELVELVEVVQFGGRQTIQRTANRNQYINLDDNVDKSKAHPEFGRCILLRARVGWKLGDGGSQLPKQEL